METIQVVACMGPMGPTGPHRANWDHTNPQEPIWGLIHQTTDKSELTRLAHYVCGALSVEYPELCNDQPRLDLGERGWVEAICQVRGQASGWSVYKLLAACPSCRRRSLLEKAN